MRQSSVATIYGVVKSSAENGFFFQNPKMVNIIEIRAIEPVWNASNTKTISLNDGRNLIIGCDVMYFYRKCG